MTPCFFLFGASNIPIHFEEMIFHLFPLFLTAHDNTAFIVSHSDVHGYVVDMLP